MKNINYGLIVLVAVVAAVVSSLVTYKAVAKNSSKFAIIDMPRVVVASKEVNALKAERANQIQELQKMADEANKKIKAESKEAEKKKLTEQYMAEINAKKAGYDKLYATALQTADQKITGIINSVAEKEGLKAVLLKSSVVDGGVDITDSVIEQVR